ncbi:MAG: hypothetical protein Q9165_006812 [Trypethelium subeluteriae]
MIDVQPLLHRLFLDVSTDFLFGSPIGVLGPELPAESLDFLQSFSTAQRWLTRRREAGWTSFRYDYSREWREAYSKVHKFVDQQVERALRETEKEDRLVPDEPGVRKRYVLLDELAKQIRDPIALRYQILGVLLPARDTTSRAVGNALFQLARHPQIWQRLRQVSLTVDSESLTFEKLKSFVEFRYVVQETIRLIGPAARVVRVAIRDTILPVGGGPDRKSPLFVAKGTTVSLGTWGVQHDADIWGDDVQEFRPDRWKGRKVYWEFVPFSGGPRICPAQQQVLTHTIYMLIRLAQKFESIENCDPVLEYLQKFTLGAESWNGVKVAFKKAS